MPTACELYYSNRISSFDHFAVFDFSSWPFFQRVIRNVECCCMMKMSRGLKSDPAKSAPIQYEAIFEDEVKMRVRERETRNNIHQQRTVATKINRFEIVDLRDVCDQVETPFYD